MHKRTIWILILTSIVVLFAGSAYLLYSPRWVYEVAIAGQSVGYVNSLEEYNAIIQDVHQQAVEQWDCDLVMNEEVSATRTRLWSPETAPAEVRAGIEDMATFTASGWAIVINNETVAMVDSEETAMELVEEVKNSFLPQGKNRTLVSVDFKEEISIERVPVNPELVMDGDTVLALLLSGQEEFSTYVVKRGDTLSGIARSNNTSVTSLREANPQVNNDTIQIGQVLNLETSTALLHVETVEELKVTESIPRPVKYQANSDMSVRGDQVLQGGADGSREVVYKVEKVNGVEVRRTQVSSSVIRQPETKVVLTGIGYWPARPTGMFRFPLNTGSVSSPFGNRKNGFHRGIDIATARGTPIYAAADGTVRTRAFTSSYGYHVVIEHANGYSTLYAHATSISSSVRVGQKVVRGQVIAWVGSTGFSTGPHLHWEVSRNGQLINPLTFFGN